MKDSLAEFMTVFFFPLSVRMWMARSKREGGRDVYRVVGKKVRKEEKRKR